MASAALALAREEREREENADKSDDYYNLYKEEKKEDWVKRVLSCLKGCLNKKSRVYPEGFDPNEPDFSQERPPDFYSNPAYWSGNFSTLAVLSLYLRLATLCRMIAGSSSGEVLITEELLTKKQRRESRTSSRSSGKSWKDFFQIFPPPGPQRTRMCYVNESIGTLRIFDMKGQLTLKMENAKLVEIVETIASPSVTKRTVRNQIESSTRISDKFNNLILLTILVAGVNVGIQTYPDMDSNGLVVFLDVVVLMIFTAEMGIKIVIEGLAPHRYLTGPDWRWNAFDATIIILSYPNDAFQEIFGQGNSIQLLRLVRLARLGKLINKLPALRMIVQGLLAGLSSIRYVVILLVLVFYLYGVVGFYLFAANDPFHFGSLPMAMLTLFRVATLDNWADIMYLNIYGCDYYPDVYSPQSTGQGANNNITTTISNSSATTSATEASLIASRLFTCTDPQPSVVAGTIFFLSFVVIAALVMLSLFIGAVTVAMVDNMEELKRMVSTRKAEAAKAINEERALTMSKMREKDIKRKRKSLAMKVGGRWGDRKFSEIGPDDDDDGDDSDDSEDEDSVETLQKLIKRNPCCSLYYMYKIVRVRMREKDALHIKEEIAVNLKIAVGKSDKLDKDIEETADDFRARSSILERLYNKVGKLFTYILATRTWQALMTIVILVASMLVGMQTDYRLTRHEQMAAFLDALEILVQLIFSGEIILKVVALGTHPLMFFKDAWNNFDLLLVIGGWVPGVGGGFIMLRLLRLLRILKLVKRFRQLGVVVNALVNGASSIGYIALVLILFFYIYSIIGMLLFSSSDPWHFGLLHTAFMTLFKGITLDGWTSNAYTLMFGCQVYGGYAYEVVAPSSCPSGAIFDSSGGGALIAVAYYLILILIGTQVLLSLFIGVISTSLDDSRAASLAEQELDRRLAATAKKFMLTPERVTAFKTVFNLLDLDQGGSIDIDELKQGLESISASMSDNEIMEILIKIDPEGIGLDVNAFINFMTETPLFTQGSRIVKLLHAFSHFGGGVGGLSKSYGKNKGFWYMLCHPSEMVSFLMKPFIDLMHGGRAARERMDEMYAALHIQDVWRGRKRTRKAQSEAKAIIQQKMKEQLATRLALQRHIEQDGNLARNKVILDGRKYNDEGEFVADVLG